MKTRTFKLTGTALSVFETDVLDWELDDLPDDLAPLRQAWSAKAKGLVVNDANAEEVRAALNELSNACDALVEEPSIEREERSVYRRAAGAFATLMMKIGRAARGEE